MKETSKTLFITIYEKKERREKKNEIPTALWTWDTSENLPSGNNIKYTDSLFNSVPWTMAMAQMVQVIDIDAQHFA